jgi:epoxyqueuosine reductase
MTLAAIDAAARATGLTVFGAFHPDPGDLDTGGAGTLVLLGPSRDFWDIVTAAAEFSADDPVDRWSERVVSALADRFAARAIFPFGGPPYAPFPDWAKRSGRAWASPVGMLVHDTSGLLVSYRGALALDRRIEIPPARAASPCGSCDAKPCLTACPVAALGAQGYDVAACQAYLDSPAGRDCMTRGCAVRRACPVSQGAHRTEAQSAHHMRAFRGDR